MVRKAVKTLQLNGIGEQTQLCNTRAVRTLSDFYEKEPDKITEEGLQEYFLPRKNESKWVSITLRICCCGIRCFYLNVLKRNWHIFNILKAQSEHRLPSVLSPQSRRAQTV